MSVMPFAMRQKLLRSVLDQTVAITRAAVFNASAPDAIVEKDGEYIAQWRAGAKVLEVSVRTSGTGASSIIWWRSDGKQKWACSEPDGSVHMRWLLFAT